VRIAFASLIGAATITAVLLCQIGAPVVADADRVSPTNLADKKPAVGGSFAVAPCPNPIVPGNAVTATIPVGTGPIGVTVRPIGSKLVYVTNSGSNDVSQIDEKTNTVTRTYDVGEGPVAFGTFEEKATPTSLVFAGTPGFSNCEGQSIAALDRQFGSPGFPRRAGTGECGSGVLPVIAAGRVVRKTC